MATFTPRGAPPIRRFLPTGRPRDILADFEGGSDLTNQDRGAEQTATEAGHLKSRLPAPLRVLVGTQFGMFCAGNGLSLVGTWMQRIGCGWLIWNWTHSAFWLGILSAGDLLPVVLIGPFAGVLADRWDRLRQNFITQAVSALVALLMAALLWTGHLGLLALVALITVQGALTAVIQPARLAMVQQMVPREDMATAVAMNSVIVNLARLLGPAVAGVVILQASVVWVFVLNAAVTLNLVFVLARLRLSPQDRTRARRGFFAEMADGFTHVLTTPALRLILFAMLCGGAIVRAMIELMPAIAARSFTDAAAGLAILTGTAAAGAVASGLTIRRGAPKRLLPRVMLWWGLGALAAIALTQAPEPLIAEAAALAVGFAITRGLVTTQTFVQLTTPDVLRGRVLSVHGLIARGSPAIGALLIGYLTDRIGLPVAVLICAIALIVLLLALAPIAARVAHGMSVDDG